MALDYTLTYKGLTIGNGTNVPIMQFDGLEDLPDFRTSDVAIGYGWGELPGVDYPAGRDIAVDFLVLDSGGNYFTTLEALKAATEPDVESVILFQLAGRAQRQMIGRIRRRKLPVNANYTFRYGEGSLEFHCTDPRIYDVAVTSGTLLAFIGGTAGWDATAGTGVDAGWDATAGTGVDAGWDATAGTGAANLLSFTNAGSVDTYPVLVFSNVAGFASVTVTNQTNGQQLIINQPVTPGQLLTANMPAAATGASGLPISVDGANRYGAWAPPRQPFALAPGVNVLRLDVVGDQAASALITAQSAYL